ncbi:rhamnogalacturonan lyase [Gracilibacillus oryzae]|uniref:Rhamnogalacturonan lyase n=1 Tax=Gracilibacillus oryzae TaxID=1672701 RepID=A0A7C8GW97_9BACI|nr:rhamnogalacturonan lyase [Gracilibacillus oryzae]KAB8139363.1 rhamnogalacturonan lyase [Gracilibacillus oryzae]
MKISNYVKRSFFATVIVVLVLSHFSFLPIAALEGVPESEEFKGIYQTDFGDSGSLTPENWGFTTSGATLSINEEEIDGNNTPKMDFSVVDQSGGRLATKTFDTPVMGSKLMVEFDWYPGNHNDKGTHANENGGEFRILDGAGNTVFTLNHTKNEVIKYFPGNKEAAETGFQDPNAWYNIKVAFDLIKNEAVLTLENKATGESETHHTSLSDVSFDGTITAIRLAGIRTSGNNHTWTTYLDNIGIYHVPIAENVITTIPSLPYHRVYVGDATENLETIGLPKTVPVGLASNETVEVTVEEWHTVDKDWDPNQAGVYEFEGTLAENSQIENLFERTATIYVYNRLTPPETNRDTEWLDRGVIALKADDGIFVSWRLLADEYDKDVTFNLYRNGNKLNSKPLSVTNYTDSEGEAGAVYTVETLVNGKKTESKEVIAASENYLSLPLQKPADGTTATGDYTYSANDASVGDLDGDGEYEIIILWRPSNAMTALEDVITGPTIFDAYELDGTLMWRMNMGMNLTSGPQYHQFVVADMNADGKSEFLIKTADATTVYGATDGKYDPDKVISVIGNPEDNGRWINEGGHVVDGPEYVSVFNGDTGEVIDTIDFAFPVEKEKGDHGISWGDNFYNRADRFLSGVAYVNGKTPSAIYGRGYYARTGFVSYSLNDGKLVEDWVFDTDDAGRGEGLGNHNLATGDVDNDGFDEIIAGSLTLDHDGTILYAMDGEMGREQGSHGDALHVGAFDPAREGLQIFGVHEATSVASLQYRDGATGETIKSFYAYKDAGRGVAANIASNPGYEYWGTGGGTVETGGGVYNVQGDIITDSFRDIGLPVNFVTYWDGDLYHELLDGTTISKYDEKTNEVTVLESFEGVVSNNGTKANPSLQADILGDWREEAIYPTEDSSELRIFSTTIPTEYRLPTLMHDTVYRMGIAWQNTTYNQPPHISYYLGEDMREDVINGDLEFPKVDYTINVNAIKHELQLASTDKKLSVLFNKLDQAQHHHDKGKAKQAVKQLDDFIKHLAKSNLDSDLQAELHNDVLKLKDLWNE